MSATISGIDFYEVRLRAWNCSCPAFTLASFREFLGGGSHGALDAPDTGGDSHVMDEDWVLGDGDGGCTSEGRRRAGARIRGPSTDENAGQEGDAPVVMCKHLLACVLGSKCPGLFDGGVEEVTANTKEAAAWCAGW